MHGQEHPTHYARDHIVFNAGGQHQQMAGVKVMQLAFGRDLEVAFEQMNHHDAFGAVRWQAREMTKEKQRHRGGAVLIQRLLSMPGLTGLKFLSEFRRHLVQIVLVLRRGEAACGMLPQSLGLGNLPRRLGLLFCHENSFHQMSAIESKNSLSWA